MSTQHESGQKLGLRQVGIRKHEQQSDRHALKITETKQRIWSPSRSWHHYLCFSRYLNSGNLFRSGICPINVKKYKHRQEQQRNNTLSMCFGHMSQANIDVRVTDGVFVTDNKSFLDPRRLQRMTQNLMLKRHSIV